LQVTDPMRFPSPKEYRRVGAGLITGAIAGVVAIVFMSLAYWALGLGNPFAPLRLLCASVLGETALLPSAGILLLVVGTLFVLFASALVGGIFGLVTQGETRTALLIPALATGLLLWIALQFSLFPSGINLAMALRTPAYLFALGGVAYGVTLLLMPKVLARLAREELQEIVEHPTTVPRKKSA
jgi:hypothetical protein